jgi:hypothetical protein
VGAANEDGVHNQRFYGGSIHIVTKTGNTFGSPTTIVPAVSGKNSYYPSFAPDSKLLDTSWHRFVFTIAWTASPSPKVTVDYSVDGATFTRQEGTTAKAVSGCTFLLGVTYAGGSPSDFDPMTIDFDDVRVDVD